MEQLLQRSAGLEPESAGWTAGWQEDGLGVGEALAIHQPLLKLHSCAWALIGAQLFPLSSPVGSRSLRLGLRLGNEIRFREH